MTLEQLREKLHDLGMNLDDQMISRLQTYMSLLIEWNQKMNLTAITEPSEIVEKHFYDSILPLTEFQIEGTAADVGSGAGFPGLVWKIVRPDLDITLIEPTGKRCTFLNHVIHELKLNNIEVVNQRSEDFVKDHRESFDTVTARAVANLRVLSELCVPLIRINGYFLVMKGSSGNDELKEAGNALKTLGMKMQDVRESELNNGEKRINILLKKVRNTPDKYPRNYGQIKKKPL